MRPRKNTYIGAKEDVDEADKSLGADHALPEVHGVSHLSHEGNKEDGTAVGICRGVSLKTS